MSRTNEAIGLESAIDLAQQFGAAAARLDEAVNQWRQRYRTHDVSDDSAAELLNRCMKRLSRLLVPIQSTAKGTYGHDPYGLTSQTTMIPCLYDVAHLAQLPVDDEERWMLETQLVRERNRVVDALSDASTVIDETLGLLK